MSVCRASTASAQSIPPVAMRSTGSARQAAPSSRW